MTTNSALSRLVLLAGLAAAASNIYAQQSKATTTLTGQLVCSDCWAEADRKTTPYGTAADIACARDCAERGIPSAIAVKENNDYKLYLIEPAQLKKNHNEWLDRIGGKMEVTGKLYSKKGKQYVTVETYKFLSAPSPGQQTTIGSKVELSRGLVSCRQAGSEQSGEVRRTNPLECLHLQGLAEAGHRLCSLCSRRRRHGCC